jgi:hypothetical protein
VRVSTERSGWRTILFASAAAALLGSGSARATPWAELGDAGELPASAQQPVGSGVLDSISGTIAAVDDRDLFRIRITDPAAFSAITSGGDPTNPATQLDAILALFDASGRGIVLNDDRVLNDGDGELGALPLGATPGIYYLAIFDDDSLPVSGSGSFPDDLIWTPPVSPFTGQRVPDGGGASAPISGWVASSSDALGSGYVISLVGATFVPEPQFSALALFATLALAGLRGLRPVRRSR